MDPLAIIELQRWGFPGVTKCRHRSIEFLTTQADQSKGDILIDYVLIKFSFHAFYMFYISTKKVIYYLFCVLTFQSY